MVEYIFLISLFDIRFIYILLGGYETIISQKKNDLTKVIGYIIK